MTLNDKLKKRFGIADNCSNCVRKRRDCYAQNVSLNDLCEVLNEAKPQAVISTYKRLGHAVGKCPCCGKTIIIGHCRNFCGNCGQAIEWNDNERGEYNEIDRR